MLDTSQGKRWDFVLAGGAQWWELGIIIFTWAFGIMSTVSDTRGVERVVVAQVLRRQRFRHISIEEGSRRVIEINEFLSVTQTTSVFGSIRVCGSHW